MAIHQHPLICDIRAKALHERASHLTGSMAVRSVGRQKRDIRRSVLCIRLTGGGRLDKSLQLFAVGNNAADGGVIVQ